MTRASEVRSDFYMKVMPDLAQWSMYASLLILPVVIICCDIYTICNHGNVAFVVYSLCIELSLITWVAISWLP